MKTEIIELHGREEMMEFFKDLPKMNVKMFVENLMQCPVYDGMYWPLPWEYKIDGVPYKFQPNAKGVKVFHN